MPMIYVVVGALEAAPSSKIVTEDKSAVAPTGSITFRWRECNIKSFCKHCKTVLAFGAAWKIELLFEKRNARVYK